MTKCMSCDKIIEGDIKYFRLPKDDINDKGCPFHPKCLDDFISSIAKGFLASMKARNKNERMMK